MGRWQSTLLTVIGSAGVIGTGVLSGMATPKAMRLIEEATIEKEEELTTVEKIKVAAPAYIPAILLGAATVSCIVGAHILDARYQASLASAYALLDRSYKEYREKVADLYGDDADSKVKEEIAKEHYEEDVIMTEPREGEVMFFDCGAMRYFYAPMNEVVDPVVMDDGRTCYVISTPYSDWPLNSIY